MIIQNKIIILVFFCLAFQSDQEEIIKWQKDIKLKWTDYKAYLQRGTPVGAGSAVGIQCKSITKSNEKILMEIVAYFEKKKSGVWPEKASEKGLIHEQGHFDLAEIYTRKLRAALQNYQYKIKSDDFENEINKLHKIYSDSLIYFHNKYDNETGNSQITEKQKEWNSYIKEQLRLSEFYNNHYVRIYFAL